MRYDIAVIGGGPAGYTAALEAAGLGLSAVLFEYDKMGGTCLNRGCVPTKFLAHAAELFREAGSASRYGISFGGVQMDYAMCSAEKERVVTELREGLEALIQQKRICVVHEPACIIDSSHVSAGVEVYEAADILIASGSVPSKPFVENAVTSDELLSLDHIPESLEVIGGGVVAVEFADIFSSLGTRVTMSIRGERLLRKWDRDLAVGLAQHLKKKGVQIRTRCSPDEMCTGTAELTLSATGRSPRLPEVAGSPLFELGSDGGIVVDRLGRTLTNGMYAAGDVISGSVQLAHVAMEQAKRIVQHIAGADVQSSAAVVSCIYTTPEIASVGVTEAEASAAGIDAVSAKQPMHSNARTLISTAERSFIKLTADRSTGKLIGAQLMCERASDIAAELALAVNAGITAEQLSASTRPHPSFCEAVTDAACLLREKLR